MKQPNSKQQQKAINQWFYNAGGYGSMAVEYAIRW